MINIFVHGGVSKTTNFYADRAYIRGLLCTSAFCLLFNFSRFVSDKFRFIVVVQAIARVAGIYNWIEVSLMCRRRRPLLSKKLSQPLEEDIFVD